jgi:hypothetical protein
MGNLHIHNNSQFKYLIRFLNTQMPFKKLKSQN